MEVKKTVKFDPNTEAFQLRAEWKKSDDCRKQWFERWSWLLEERKLALENANAIREEFKDAVPKTIPKLVTTKSLKPVPITSYGFVGWLANKPDCRLEKYTSWLQKIPLRLPDAWDHPDYVNKPTK